MKKFLILLIVILLTAGAAHAVPFQITGGSLDVDWDWGGGIVNYTPFITGPIELAEGESADIIFGQIEIPASLGQGTATIDADFSSPTFDDDVAISGDFSVLSLIFFSAGSLTFDQPEVFSYSYNSVPGGLLTVDIDGIVGAQLGTAVNITGKITNTAAPAPAPVPEPATMLLLGTGLVGLAGASRKRLLKTEL